MSTFIGKSSQFYTISVKGKMNVSCSRISFLGDVERDWVKPLNSWGLSDLYLCLMTARNIEF